MRRLPPNKIEQNLNGLLNLIPEETDELLQRVDQPLKEGTDPETVRATQICSLILNDHHLQYFIILFQFFQGRKYLLCDYNRDGDSYRYILLARSIPLISFPEFDISNLFIDPPGPTHTIPQSTMAFCPLRSFAAWRSSSMSCSMRTVKCTLKAAPPRCIFGTRTRASQDAFSSRRVSLFIFLNAIGDNCEIMRYR